MTENRGDTLSSCEAFSVRYSGGVIVWLVRVLIVSIAFGVGGVYAQDAAVEDLAGHYGFEEIEIVKLDWGILGLNVADFNGDGRSDIAIVNNRKAKIEILVQKEAVGPGRTQVAVDANDVDINELTPPTRFDDQSVAVPQKIYSLVCGDLNSDGPADLAFYGEPKGLYVIFQKADDAEGEKSRQLSWRTRKKIKIDDGLAVPRALVCADLNSDGAADLVLAGSDGIYIVLQKDDGSLAEPVKYPALAQTLSVQVGDLNGDKVNDLVLVTSDSEKPVHVRFGLEGGRLGPLVQFFIERPFEFSLGNLDGEPGDEILTIEGTSGRLVCYKYSGEKGDEADWPMLYYPLASGEGSTKRDLALGDFDGDGLADVAISDPGAAELILYKQTKGVGLAEPVRFPAFADIVSLSAADVDNDGKAELAILSIKEKAIGISRFADDRLSFPEPLALTGEPLAMELADIDRDGAGDCVYVSKDANDLRALRVSYGFAAAGGDREALKLKKLKADPDGLRVLDVDQDGLQDVLIFISYELPVLVRQAEKGKFKVVESPAAQASLIKDAALRLIDVADVDGRAGEELLIAQKNFARSLVFAETGSWRVVDQYNAKGGESQISAVAAFDIAGQQGRPAILLLDGQKGQLQILRAGEDKTYRFDKELDVGKWNSAVHLKMLFAPLTGGEEKSILLFDSEKFALLTPPSGRAATAQHLEKQFSYETQIKDGRYGNLAAGDINSDGKADLVMVEFRRNHFEILALDSGFKPTPAMRFKIFEEKSYAQSKLAGAAVEPRELSIADVTGDGKDDLVT
ncbi:MAG: VCBS repeat-containing protein, partial [Sedimentisphaerales bacterium]|nr:VCBS repeat-containing protein [Sedimentisphaerales bacterium]